MDSGSGSPARLREFLGNWDPAVPLEAGDATPPEFTAQCAALLAARPAAVSSIMGLFPVAFVSELKTHGIAWFACATRLVEALAAQAAGGDAVIAQGYEAGGHRGSFDAAQAEQRAVGLFALLPRLADHVSIPIIDWVVVHSLGHDNHAASCNSTNLGGAEPDPLTAERSRRPSRALANALR